MLALKQKCIPSLLFCTVQYLQSYHLKFPGKGKLVLQRTWQVPSWCESVAAQI